MLVSPFAPIQRLVAPSAWPEGDHVVKLKSDSKSPYFVRVANPTLSNLRVAIASDCCSLEGIAFESIPPLSTRVLRGEVDWQHARVEGGVLRVAVRIASDTGNRDQLLAYHVAEGDYTSSSGGSGKS